MVLRSTNHVGVGEQTKGSDSSGSAVITADFPFSNGSMLNDRLVSTASEP
jgi:hypothetical protein